jgi:phosphatidylserine decarboxylase
MTDLDGAIQPPTQYLTPSAHPSIDHNSYVKDGYIYQAAYTSGSVFKIMDDTTRRSHRLLMANKHVSASARTTVIATSFGT